MTETAHTAAQESVLRLSLAMLMADPRAAVTAEDRTWIADRLQAVDAQGQQVPFTAVERALLREPLLAYVETHHPRITEIVTRQFADDGAMDGPQRDATPRRPSDHYGVVSEKHHA